MELSHSYDFVILGEHPAGLWAAKQLLSLGQRVLIIPMGFDRGANVLPRSVAAAFQIPESDYSSRESNPIQILAGGKRVRVSPTQAEFQDEIHFNYGAPLKAGEVPKTDLLRGLAYLVRGAETGPSLPDDWALISSQLFDTVYFEKEKGWLNRFMLQSLKAQGASIAPLRSLKQVFVDRKSLVGVQLAGTSKMIAVKACFLNAQVEILNTFFNERLSLKSAPISWNFEIVFECGLDFLPVGLTTKMIYVEKDAPILEVNHETPGRFRLKTSLPLSISSMDRGEQRRLAERMLRVAENLLPDLSYNIKKVTPDLRDPDRAMSIELPGLYPFQELKRIPADLLNYGAGSTLGFQTPVQNLFISNEEVYPKLGIWSGYQAVTQALDQFGKREQRPEFSKVQI